MELLEGPKGNVAIWNTTNMLERRQRDFCSFACASYATCTGSGEATSLDDCQNLANYLSNRGQTHTVAHGQSLTEVWNTCQFQFTNTGAVDATWCDSTWASQSALMAQKCIPGGSPGAVCAYTQMTLYTSRNTGALTTPSGAGGQASTSSNGATESSNSGSSSGSSSITPASSSTTSISGLSLTGQTSTRVLSSAPLPEVSQTSEGGLVSGPSVSSIQGSGGDPSTGGNKHGSNTTTIVGIVVGVLAVLLVLVALWVLRRRKLSGTLGSATNTKSNDGQELELIQASPSPTAFALAPWNHSTKTAGVPPSRLSPEPISNMPSFSSVTHLITPITTIPEESDNPPDVSDVSASSVGGEQLQQQQRVPPISFRPTYDALRGGNRSMSARSLAQALAPQLSEDDIDRLANSIVTRMPVAPLAPHGLRTQAVQQDQVGSDVGVGLSDDPPPPWRESWGSNHGT
ncbi:hypothetical protein FRB91_007526 [Serendipita sp. 411]|nr:hypothetical protein FRB91_007526 [Serendipita sp. 411]